MSGGGPHAAAGTSHSGSRPPPLPALPAPGPCRGPSLPWAPVESGSQGHLDFWAPNWKPHPGRSIPLHIPLPRHLRPLQIPSKCMRGSPSPDTWAICGSHLDAWVPPRTPHGHWGPLQFCTPQKPGSPMEHPPWTPRSPIDPPPAPTPASPTYPPFPTGCLVSSQSPSCRHSGPLMHPSPAPLCVCLSFPYGLGLSRIPPNPPCLFYAGPSWAQWARIQEEGQGKKQSPADGWGGEGARCPGSPTPPHGPPKAIR